MGNHLARGGDEQNHRARWGIPLWRGSGRRVRHRAAAEMKAQAMPGKRAGNRRKIRYRRVPRKPSACGIVRTVLYRARIVRVVVPRLLVVIDLIGAGEQLQAAASHRRLLHFRPRCRRRRWLA